MQKNMDPKYFKPGPLHEKCVEDKGCERANRGQGVCPVYISPKSWWESKGGCPMATHIDFSPEGDEREKIRVGQQKQKKRK